MEPACVHFAEVQGDGYVCYGDEAESGSVVRLVCVLWRFSVCGSVI